jgi:hypothetical protein
MFRSTLLTLALFFLSPYINAQGNSFKSAAAGNNKTWTVTKYLNSSQQQDKKDLFKHYTFQFSQTDIATPLDSTTVTVTDMRVGNRTTWKGVWDELPDNTVKISLPLGQRDNDYMQIAYLLSKAQMEKISLQPSTLSLKITDETGEILIDFSLK